MKWYEIKIKTTGEASDALSEMLISIGAGGVAICDPDDIMKEVSKSDSLDYFDEEFINSLDEDVIVKAYFSDKSNIIELMGIIKEKINFVSNFLNTGSGELSFCEIDEEDWASSWKKYYKPFLLTDNIVIKPSWENYQEKTGEIIIELDPGMAFGTGTHETTKLCSELLSKYVKKDDRVIDLGSGTGILSIVAAKLGASKVTAVDIDEVAVRIARDNFNINNVSNLASVSKGIIDDIYNEKVDIIVANIIANVIIDMTQKIPRYLKQNGLFLTSGIIKDRIDEVVDVYQKAGFEHVLTKELGEWGAIVFRCQNSL